MCSNSRELDSFVRLMTRLNQVLSLDNVLDILVEESWKLYRKGQVTIQLVRESGWVETVAASYADASICHMKFPPGDGIVGMALRDQCLINIGDITVSEDFIPGSDCSEAFSALMVVPLVHNNITLGAMSVNSGHINAFTSFDEDRFSRLAQYASHAVAHALIYEKLQREEKKYRELVEKSLQGILVFDGDDIVYANPAAIALYGNMSGLTVYDLLRNDRIQTVGGREVALKPEMLGKFEVAIKECNDSTSWLEVQIIRLDEETIQVIFLDVTARVEMARLQEQAIREKDTAIGRYTEVMKLLITTFAGMINGDSS